MCENHIPEVRFTKAFAKAKAERAQLSDASSRGGVDVKEPPRAIDKTPMEKHLDVWAGDGDTPPPPPASEAPARATTPPRKAGAPYAQRRARESEDREYKTNTP